MLSWHLLLGLLTEIFPTCILVGPVFYREIGSTFSLRTGDEMFFVFQWRSLRLKPCRWQPRLVLPVLLTHGSPSWITNDLACRMYTGSMTNEVWSHHDKTSRALESITTLSSAFPAWILNTSSCVSNLGQEPIQRPLPISVVITRPGSIHHILHASFMEVLKYPLSSAAAATVASQPTLPVHLLPSTQHLPFELLIFDVLHLPVRNEVHQQQLYIAPASVRLRRRGLRTSLLQLLLHRTRSQQFLDPRI